MLKSDVIINIMPYRPWPCVGVLDMAVLLEIALIGIYRYLVFLVTGLFKESWQCNSVKYYVFAAVLM